MPTCSKSLVIFTLFAVLWLENKAHHCGSPRKKTNKKFDEGKTSSTTPETTSTSTSTTAPLINVDPRCNTGTVPSCKCGIDVNNSVVDVDNYDSYYYPVPKSGNVFKSTTPDYHFREDNCHKKQRTVCKVSSDCGDFTFGEQPPVTMPPTSKRFVLGQYISGEPFCKCGYDADHHPIPKSGNCTDLEKTYNLSAGLSCDKARTLCTDTCYCNVFYVVPTECDPQTCNNASKPFCTCGIDDVIIQCQKVEIARTFLSSFQQRPPITNGMDPFAENHELYANAILIVNATTNVYPDVLCESEEGEAVWGLIQILFYFKLGKFL